MEIIINLLISILGWIAGMIVNYAVDVFSKKSKLSKPFCWNCEQEQSLKNYFLFPRKCENCGKSRRPRVIITEIAFIIIAIFLWNYTISSIPYALSLIFFMYAAFALIMDFETKEVAMTITGIIIFGVMGLVVWGWLPTLLGGLISTAIMLALYYFGKLMVRITIKRRGLPEDTDLIALGFGDVYLALLMGLSLGFPTFLVGFFLTILLGGFISLIVIIINLFNKKSSAQTAIAYGPYIIISIIFVLYFLHFFI